MASNLTNQSRNVFSKMIMNKDEVYNPNHIFVFEVSFLFTFDYIHTSTSLPLHVFFRIQLPIIVYNGLVFRFIFSANTNSSSVCK